MATNITSHENSERQKRRLTSSVIDLREFDSFGFDLDLTLIPYRSGMITEKVYDKLIKYLNSKSDFQVKLELYSEIKHLVYKGVILDVRHGNVISLASDGNLDKVYHGLSLLSEDEITSVYGGKLWVDFNNFKNKIFSMTFSDSEDIANRLENKWFCFDTEWDICGPAVFALLVDNNKPEINEGKNDLYVKLWKQLAQAFQFIYEGADFGKHEDSIFSMIENKTDYFVSKLSPETINFLKTLKSSNKFSFLLTSSKYNYVNLVLQEAYGENWEDLFDAVFTQAGKPSFFKENDTKKFYVLNSNNETDIEEVDSCKLQHKKVFARGNIFYINKLIQEQTKIEKPRVLYIGDSLRCDIYPGSMPEGWRTAAVIKSLTKDIVDLQVDKALTSKRQKIEESAGEQELTDYFLTEIGTETQWWHAIQKHSYFICKSFHALSCLKLDSANQLGDLDCFMLGEN